MLFFSTEQTTRIPIPTPARENAKLFSASWCSYCKQAKRYLSAKNITYDDYDIDTPMGRSAFNSIGGGSIPLLIWRGLNIHGFSRTHYDAVFNQANQ